ncbi:MAG: hypothetical protein IPL55_10125 [Saprospiraceae bacterium]|nr:hypothetical protein [Saprospiraceae bacterium]
MSSFSKVIIYPKDIASSLVRATDHLGNYFKKSAYTIPKGKHQVVTVQEFCEYMGIAGDEILTVIK